MKKLRSIFSMMIMLLIMISGTCFASEKIQVSIPEIDSKRFTYIGKVISPKFENFDETLMNIEGNTGIEVGKYIATISLKDKENCEWEIYDEARESYIYTTEDQEYEWEIIKLSPSIYTSKQRKIKKVYNGEEQKVEVSEILNPGILENENVIRITGNVAKEVGEYELTISVVDKERCNSIYVYCDGKYQKVDTYTIPWEITRYAEISVPEFTENKYEYADGEIIKPKYVCENISEYDLYKICDVKFPEVSEVGRYTITYSIKDKLKYQWSDGTQEDKIYTWEIIPKKVRLPSISYKYNGNEMKMYSTSIYDVLETETSKDAGKYVATVSLIDKDNYEWEIYDKNGRNVYTTTDDQEVDWEIEKYTPAIYSRVQKNLKKVYNRKEQKIELEEIFGNVPENILSITGNVAKEIGKYQLTISVIDKRNCNNIVVYIGDLEIVQSITLPWEIKQFTEISLPEVDEVYEYADGEVIEPRFRSESFSGNELYRICDIKFPKASEVGEYTIKFSIKDKSKYKWSDGTQEDKTCTWEILPKKVKCPSEFLNSIYDGSEKTALLVGYDENIMDITNNKAIECGGYKAKVSLKDTENYEWSTGTTDPQYVDWYIVMKKEVPKRILEVPELINYTYDGKEHIAKINKNFSTIIVENEKYRGIDIGAFCVLKNITKQKNAGEYSLQVSLIDKDNFVWKLYDKTNDSYIYTNEDQEIKWNIRKYTGHVYLDSQERLNRVYNGKKQEVSLNEVFDAGFFKTSDFMKSLYNIEGNIGTNVGKYTLRISVKDQLNAKLGKGMTNDEIVVDWEILKQELDMPTLKSNFKYDGKEKVITLINFDEKLMKVSGNKAKESGKYKATVSLKDKENYQWKNGTTDDIVINWSITGEKVSTGGGSGGGSSESTKTYKAKITQTKGGKITVDNLEVEEGETQKFTIVPEKGYKIVDVKIDGKSVGPIEKYTIENVSKRHTIVATFEKITEEEKEEKEQKEDTIMFSDVKLNDWYYEAVKFVKTNGIFKGLSENAFGANVSMNRAMAVTVLYRFAGEKKILNNKIIFNDISGEQYYSNAVIWAVENGIVNGIGDNKFAPENDVTREQLVVMLYRYLKSNGKVKKENVSLAAYDDNEMISDYAKEAFVWAVKNGIITGRTSSTLVPQGFITRAEVATIIMRFCKMDKTK